jgi:3-hydroxyacyl-CoA dehydrogenase
MKSFKNIGIIGAGSMGVGIAQIASNSDMIRTNL